MKEFTQEAAAGWRATRMLIALRSRMMRTGEVRLAVAVGAIVAVLIAVVDMNLGFAAQTVAQQNDAAGIFGRLWVSALADGSMLNIGTFAIGGALVAVLFAPFTGAATLSLMPVEDLEALRPPRTHRYFDSFVINMISGLGLLQFFAMTGVASLLTMDGFRLPGLLFAWSLWLLLIASMSSVGWTLEWVVRRFGATRRRFLAAGLLALIAGVVLLDPRHGATLFGLSRLFGNAMRSGVHGWNAASVTLPVATLLVAAAAITLGLVAVRAALRLPTPIVDRSKPRRFLPVGKTPTRIAWSMLVRVLWRTPEVSRPIISLTLVGAVTMLFIPMNENVEFSILAAAPFTVALAFGLNVFGILGTGMVWMGSQPKILNRLPLLAFALQVALSLLLLAVLWAASFLSGHASVESAGRLLAGGALAAVACAALGTFLSVTRPIRARLSGRSDSLVPPLTALGYLVWLILLGPVPVGLLLTTGDPVRQLLVVVGVSTVSLLLLLCAMRRWSNRAHRARVIALTSVA